MDVVGSILGESLFGMALDSEEPCCIESSVGPESLKFAIDSDVDAVDERFGEVFVNAPYVEIEFEPNALVPP
jgi:hypothetical protein